MKKNTILQKSENISFTRGVIRFYNVFEPQACSDSSGAEQGDDADHQTEPVLGVRI